MNLWIIINLQIQLTSKYNSTQRDKVNFQIQLSSIQLSVDVQIQLTYKSI